MRSITSPAELKAPSFISLKNLQYNSPSIPLYIFKVRVPEAVEPPTPNKIDYAIAPASLPVFSYTYDPEMTASTPNILAIVSYVHSSILS